MEGRPRDDRALVASAQRGDTHAFEQLIEPHLVTMFRVAFLMTRSAADAEDAVQDATLKAWRALGRFRTGAPLLPWLLKIAANEGRNRRRSAGRREGLALRLAASPGEAAPSPEEAALAAERRQGLLDALDALPDPVRLVLECRFLLALSEEETAAALGVRPGTVKSRTARGLERLREAYAARA